MKHNENIAAAFASYNLICNGEKQLEEATYTSFGIACECNSEVVVLDDISSDKSYVEKICTTLNKFEVSVLHFRDVVEDIIANPTI